MFHVENRTAWDNAKLASTFAFLGGYTAIASLLLFGLFVTCMTGNTTDMGIALGFFDYHEFVVYLFVYISFVSGGFICAKIFDRMGHVPVLCLEAALLFLVGSDTLSMPFIAFVAALAMGLQNSLTTCATWKHGKIRCTHVTGTSTDFGISIGNRDREAFKAKLLTLVCYTSGCLVAYFTTLAIHHRAFTIGGIFVIAAMAWDMLTKLLGRGQEMVVEG